MKVKHMPAHVAILKSKLRVCELERENNELRSIVHDLKESLKESTRLLQKQKPSRPSISADKRMMIAGKARFKCQNPWGDCHLYRLPPYDGSIDECGYELDHITPHSQCYQTIGQLQLLCPQCHAKKTRLDRIRSQEEEQQVGVASSPLPPDQEDECDYN